MPPQIPLNTKLAGQLTGDVNTGIKAVTGTRAPGMPGIPDWLVDMVVPPDASMDPSDVMNPMGSVMSKGLGPLDKLGKALYNRMRGMPKASNVVEIAKPVVGGRAIGDAQPAPHIQEGRTTKIPVSYDDHKAAKKKAKKLRDAGKLKGQPVAAPSWNELTEMSKLNKPDDLGYISGYSNNVYSDPKSLPLRDVDAADWADSDFMKEVNTLDKQGTHQTIDMIKLLDANIPDTNIRLPSDWKLGYAKDQNIPLNIPLVTYDSGVPIGEAERASKILNTLMNRQLSAEPSSFVKTMHIRPEPGGLFQKGNIVAGIDSSDPAKLTDTVGHEFQHAIDKQYNKDVFKDYPNTMFAGLTGPPTGYFNHPSETRARAAGRIARLLEEETITGQQPIDPRFLFEFGTGIERIGGEADDALVQLAKRQSKPEYKYQSPPTALKLPFRNK